MRLKDLNWFQNVVEPISNIMGEPDVVQMTRDILGTIWYEAANRYVRPLFEDETVLKVFATNWARTNYNQIRNLVLNVIQQYDSGVLTSTTIEGQFLDGSVGVANTHGINSKNEQKTNQISNTTDIDRYLRTRINYTNIPLFKELINEICETFIPW